MCEAGIIRLSLARGDPAEKVSGAELGANPGHREAAWLLGERKQVLACPALAVGLEGRVEGGQGWEGSPSCSPSRWVLTTAPLAAGHPSFLRVGGTSRWYRCWTQTGAGSVGEGDAHWWGLWTYQFRTDAPVPPAPRSKARPRSTALPWGM